MSAQINLPEIRHDAPLPREYLPKLDHLVTEDDTPMDNIYAEKQMRLWAEALYTSWRPEEPYVAMANVGLFYKEGEPAIVPDFMYARGVSMPTGNPLEKRHRSYFMWIYGKRPDAVLELVSNTDGGEDTRKRDVYSQIGVPYYVIWDPELHLSGERLRLYAMHEDEYLPIQGPVLKNLGLGLTVWQGKYEDMEANWLRWTDQNGQLILTGAERAAREAENAATERQRADAERQRADAEKQRADAAQQRAERLATKLRTLGIDPNGGE